MFLSFDDCDLPARRLSKAEGVAAILLIAAGFAARGVAAVYSMGIVHPDEHQQYLEQANRLAYGYGETYWEQARGMRSWLYPGVLAGCLLAFDACGVTDPIMQAAGIRMVLASASFLVLIVFAWRLDREGQRLAAMFYLAWTALSPFMVFLSVRALSEAAAIGPLYLAVLLIPRRAGLAGVLFAITFAIRFQTGIMIAVIFGLLLADCLRSDAGRRWKMLRLLAGFAATMLALGWLDDLTLGSWFHSPIEYFRANIAEHGSAAFGVKPWHYYLEGYASLFAAFPLAGVCLILGAVREWRLAVVAAIHVAAHSAIGHKENRFLWTLAPAAYLLAAVGTQLLWDRIANGAYRVIAVGLVAFSVAWVEAISVPNVPWNRKAYVESSLALVRVGRRPDVTGVAVCDLSRVIAGNYFFLRRPVPLVMEMRLDKVLAALEERPEINYLIADPADIAAFAKWRPAEADRVGDMGIYCLHREKHK